MASWRFLDLTQSYYLCTLSFGSSVVVLLENSENVGGGAYHDISFAFVFVPTRKHRIMDVVNIAYILLPT